jgi:hypothetical protein
MRVIDRLHAFDGSLEQAPVSGWRLPPVLDNCVTKNAIRVRN